MRGAGMSICPVMTTRGGKGHWFLSSRIIVIIIQRACSIAAQQQADANPSTPFGASRLSCLFAASREQQNKTRTWPRSRDAVNVHSKGCLGSKLLSLYNARINVSGNRQQKLKKGETTTRERDQVQLEHRKHRPELLQTGSDGNARVRADRSESGPPASAPHRSHALEPFNLVYGVLLYRGQREDLIWQNTPTLSQAGNFFFASSGVFSPL